MRRILIVEDDVIICGGVKLFLEQRGYAVETAYSRKEADACMQHGFDLILLDRNLPDGAGLDYCRQLRDTMKVPIIFLTAKDTDEDMIEGFRAGCDDYIAKPFSVELLYQRIEAVLRRSVEDKNHARFHYNNMTVDFERMQVFLSEEPVKLSGTEYRILELLIRNKGRVVTRDTILQRIWDCYGNYVDENTLSVYIRRLRQKIEEDAGNPQYIITVFGIGYTFGEEA